MGNTTKAAAVLSEREWDVDVLLANGIEYTNIVRMAEVRESIKEARDAGIKREQKASVPLIAWVVDLVADDVAFSFPGVKIKSFAIQQN